MYRYVRPFNFKWSHQKEAASATKRTKFCETFATAPDIKPRNNKKYTKNNNKIKNILQKEGEKLNRKEDFLITLKKKKWAEEKRRGDNNNRRV